MPRRIVFHPGFHLTGTSALQHALRENRVALKPYLALRLPWHMKDLLASTRAYAAKRDTATLTQAQDQFAALLDDLPGMPRRSLIVSSADLLGQVPGRGTVANYGAAPGLLYALWDVAKRRFPEAEIRLFLTTRSAATWAQAIYAHHLETSKLDCTAEEFRTQLGNVAQLDAMAAELASCVPAPVHTCAAEEHHGTHLGCLGPLLDLCEVPAAVQETLSAPIGIQTPKDPALLDALLDINRRHQNPTERRAAKDALLSRGE